MYMSIKKEEKKLICTTCLHAYFLMLPLHPVSNKIKSITFLSKLHC